MGGWLRGGAVQVRALTQPAGERQNRKKERGMESMEDWKSSCERESVNVRGKNPARQSRPISSHLFLCPHQGTLHLTNQFIHYEIRSVFRTSLSSLLPGQEEGSKARPGQAPGF